MNVNGVLASMCFPTMAGFNARTFTEARDREVSLVMLQAYNDWHIDEWCAAYPGRFIPLGIVPMWDIDLAVGRGQPHREEGLPRDQLPRGPALARLAELPVGPLGPDARGARRREHGAVPAHRCRVRASSSSRAEAPIDHKIVIPSQVTMLTAQDLLFGPTLRKYPGLKVALSEGGIGWIPFYLDRVDRHFQNQSWIDNSFGDGKLPSDVFREHFLACYITDPSGLKLRHEIGMDVIAWECDYPHTDTTWPDSPEYTWKEFQDAGVTDEEIHKITWENATRFFGWDPFAHIPKEQATVGALRALATDVDTTRMPREEWRKRNEAAGIGVF